MSYDPRMFEPNPGAPLPGGIHEWDQPMHPRGDVPQQAPGLDPMAFQSRIEYENARQAQLAHQRESAWRQQTGQITSRGAEEAKAPTNQQTSKPANSSVVANILPKKEQPKPTHKPAKYKVIDNRRPSFTLAAATLFVSILFKVAVTGVAFSCMLFFSSSNYTLKLLIAGLLVSIACWTAVLYRVTQEDINDFSEGDSGPIWLGVLFCSVASVVLYLINQSNFTVEYPALIGVILACLISSQFDSASDISENILRLRRVKYFFRYSPKGYKCQLCNSPAAVAIAMRRYHFKDSNSWRNYLPVCSNHQHYICEINEWGKQEWPQSGDCLQPGLIEATHKHFRL